MKRLQQLRDINDTNTLKQMILKQDQTTETYAKVIQASQLTMKVMQKVLPDSLFKQAIAKADEHIGQLNKLNSGLATLEDCVNLTDLIEPASIVEILKLHPKNEQYRAMLPEMLDLVKKVEEEEKLESSQSTEALKQAADKVVQESQEAFNNKEVVNE